MTGRQLREELRWALRAREVILVLVFTTGGLAYLVGQASVSYREGLAILAFGVCFNLCCHLLLSRYDAAEGLDGGSEGFGTPEALPAAARIHQSSFVHAAKSPPLVDDSSDDDRSAALRHLRLLRYLQVPFDALSLTLIVLFSGGAASPYVLLYSLAILASAISLSSSLVYLQAVLFAVLYGALLIVSANTSADAPSFLTASPQGDHRRMQIASLFYVSSLLLATAYLSNHIARLLRRQIGESEQRASELSAINAVATAASRSLELNDVLRAALDKVVEVMAMDVGGIYVLEKGRQRLRLAAHYGLRKETVAEHSFVSLGEGYTGLAAEAGEALYSNDTQRVPDTAPDLMSREGLLSIASIPLKAKDQVVGVLYVAGRRPHAFSPNDLRLLESIAGQIGVAVDNARLYSEVECMAITDSLTGLTNRRAFMERLDRELQLSRRLGVPLSLLLIDIDHFKRFNDTFGHLVGDQVLREVATVITGAVRTSDITARYGGEEFAVILPDTAVDGGLALSERIRRAVEGHHLGPSNPRARQRVTVSLGLATYPDHASLPEELIDAADGALYLSKKRGRNRVTVFSAEELKRV